MLRPKVLRDKDARIVSQRKLRGTGTCNYGRQPQGVCSPHFTKMFLAECQSVAARRSCTNC